MNSGSDPRFPWAELGIAPTRDIGEVRRAYARRLKAIDAVADPAGFRVLRRAYEAALALAAGEGEPPSPRPEPSPARDTAPPVEGETPGVLDPIIAEVVASAGRGNIAEAMAVLDRLIRGSGLSLELEAALQARLLSAVMDDPFMPPALLVALADRFRWNEVGSALERHRPDLYGRFLHRMGAAHAWLDRVRTLTRQGGEAGAAAHWILQRYSRRHRFTGLGRFDRAALDHLLRDARRFGLLLGDAVDPRQLDHLRQVVRTGDKAYIRSRVRFSFAVSVGVLAVFIGATWLQYYLGIRDDFYGMGRGVQSPDAKTMLIEYPESWIGFHLDPYGNRLLAYFTNLMSHRGAIAEIRYGVDKDVPDRAFDFPRDDDPHLSLIGADVPIFIEVPRNTRFLTVQLRFKEGASSPIRRYDVPADPTRYQ